MYDIEDKSKLKAWIDDIIAAAFLRKKFGTTIMKHNNIYSENTIKARCSQCGKQLEHRFGDFSKPLTQSFISCPDSAGMDKHGFWASVVNFMMN